MKKNFFIISVLAIVICLSSCTASSSFEGDVRKMANYRCKKQLLQAKDPADEKIKKELLSQFACSFTICVYSFELLLAKSGTLPTD